MSNNDKNLFSDFSPVTAAEWKEQIIKDLRGKDYDESLVWKTDEGFDIKPYYTSEDLTPEAKAFQNTAFDANEVLGARAWVNSPKINASDAKEANRKALLALKSGADGVLFEVGDAVDLAVLLEGIELPYCAVSYSLSGNPVAFANALAAYVSEKGYDPAAVKGLLSYPVANADVAGVFDALASLPAFKAFVIKGAVDATLHGDLGDLLAQTTALVDKLEGKDVKAVFDKIAFSVQVSNNYFGEIAKLRALRTLVQQIAKFYGAEISPVEVTIQGSTTIIIDEETKEDPYLNMLSNTSQAMSAVIGTCNYLTILPHNEGLEEVDDFADRIARNISNMLREESYFDKVADPAAGSYYIESLTAQLAEKAWEAFQAQL
ncbi:methylmalonyl-CoA mutase family protein [Flammeovirgaceae bacterium SG7u.111]|nr:methylmalonyl-CoA mutase family protein [Flammeovirgaceae bacterium SG7u.132]WPO33550.1 methylmalonyl-CoA mutase family protein [Flammeovirgaceae bacterium SG7u.111]